MTHPVPQKTSSNKSPIRLLIVDSDAPLRMSLVLMFMNAGFEVQYAANGKAALEIHRRSPVHIIVAEMLLPEMDGIEMLVHLAEQRAAPKFIAITAGGHLPANHYLRTARQLGAHRVLAKPFLPELLHALVMSVLND